MVATEGCKVLGHYSVLNDKPASREIDAYAHRYGSIEREQTLPPLLYHTHCETVM
jgi:hypothetical protein